MKGKRIFLSGVAGAVLVFGLFVAVIWVDDPDLRGKLGGSALLILFPLIVVFGIVGFLNDN